MVRWLSLVSVMAAAAVASAQPVDPYAPAPPPTPTPAPAPAPTPAPPTASDPVLNEQVAVSLVARAKELIEAKLYVDAKQLAVEAIVKSPTGPAAAEAQAIIKQVNAALGIAEPQPTPPIDTQVKITDDKEPVPVPHDITRAYVLPARVHGGIYLGTIGATIGSAFSDSNEAAGAVPMGIAFAAVGALVTPMIAKHYELDETQVRTVGGGTMWGGMIGGMLGATFQGADGGKVNGRGPLLGASIGSTLGILGTIGLARDHDFTTGDVALTDTFVGIGTAGGLTVGMLMQPAQKEAYTLNAALGAAAGVVTGYILAPKTNTTSRRMIRVAGVSAIGGGLPFLLYAGIHDKHATWDDRLTGGLSTLGLVGGAILGFYLTRHVDEGMDTNDFIHHDADDAPAAVLGRSSDGKWALNGVGIQPLSSQLVQGAQPQGMTLSLVGATF
ncbi:MAG: hypothetical protein QM831_41140 [Kofleriaceae bacterium]